ncbi:hypothetical protein [Streptomyces sp. NBC_01497]|uniref:hypothetical protein n=1 Tax=Streptomyces sp. NBC_01497 TaxID=2903885 RepID=UPI002E36A05F|nr:hypothetical protein [Streptomyces sp. NBC_01497]
MDKPGYGRSGRWEPGEMATRGRRTRPWGQLKGPRPEDNAAAELLRQWLDDAGGMGVDELLGKLTPEHFLDRQRPSRSTVSSRLSGVGLREDFIEAVADVCSPNAAKREQLLTQMHRAREQARSGQSRDRVAGPAAHSELLLVQQRSIEVSDKLLLAMERAAHLERERSEANQMVLVLLAMVDKLQRNIADLARERDRLRARPGGDEFQQVRERLTRTEQQRDTAEAELDRARSERQKADQLTEEAQQQVRRLTDELNQLRGDAPTARDPGDLDAAAPILRDPSSYEADDVDIALLKAAHHLDDRADRLDRLAGELHSDNPPDNSPTAHDDPDIPPEGPASPGSAVLTAEGEEVLGDIAQFLSGDVGAGLEEMLTYAAEQGSDFRLILLIAARLRDGGHPDRANRLIYLRATGRGFGELTAIVAKLRAEERGPEVYQLLNHVAQGWPGDQIVAAVTLMREAYHSSDAYQVLSAVGRSCPLKETIMLLPLLTTSDREWILEVACRERSLEELKLLQRSLRRDIEVARVALARRERVALGRVFKGSYPHQEGCDRDGRFVGFAGFVVACGDGPVLL